MRNSNLYTDIWETLLPLILKGLNLSLNKGEKMFLEMKKDCFLAAGNRKRYTFTISYVDGTTERSGTAVGRDLQKILKESSEFQKFAKGKFISINLTGQFYLGMEAKSIESL